MSCHHNNRKRIAIIAGIGVTAAAGIGYISLAANPAAIAATPAVIAFAVCPAMCAAMGGAMWLSRRFKMRDSVMLGQKKNVNEQMEAEDTKVENQLSNDNGKEVVQAQYQKRKRKVGQNDVDPAFSN